MSAGGLADDNSGKRESSVPRRNYPYQAPTTHALEQLTHLPPKDFEAVSVALFREMKTVEHSITGTRYVSDSGFDFFLQLHHAAACRL
jgi:hypothetical protein